MDRARNKTWKPRNYSAPRKCSRRMRVALISDSHYQGDSAADRAVAVKNFVEWANTEQVDLAVHCGDTIDSHITASKSQSKDWQSWFVTEWQKLTVPSAFVLGNHDANKGQDPSYYLDSSDWIAPMSWEDHPKNAGSKANYSIVVNNGRIRLKFISVCYFKTTVREELKDWLHDEIDTFQGDHIIVGCHAEDLYPSYLKDVILETNNNCPINFVCGDNHPVRTMRDTWGHESSEIDCPVIMIPGLVKGNKEMGTVFDIGLGGHPGWPSLGGFHHISSLDCATKQIVNLELGSQSRADITQNDINTAPEDNFR